MVDARSIERIRREGQMEGSWLVVAGRISLYLFFMFVGASLVAILHRRVTRLTSEPASAGTTRLSRWFMEYVGNIDASAGGAARRERRRNLSARVLMAHIMDDLASRQTPEMEAQQVVEELRESVRAVDPEQG